MRLQIMRSSNAQFIIVGVIISIAIRWSCIPQGYRERQNENAPRACGSRGVCVEGRSGRVLDVVVQDELVWMRAEAHRIHLSLPLVFDPGLHRILREHIAF